MSAPIRLQTHVWNPLGDRRALLLHGLTSDGTGWWRLASQLADAGWLVLAPDLRSHGRSPTAAAHDLATLVDDVALLGSGWELVVGHSLGGAIAAQLLARPLGIEAAVLVDPVLRLDERQRAELRLRLKEEAGRVDAAAVRAAEPTWDERDVQRKVLAASLMTPDVVDTVFADNDPWDFVATASSWQARVHLLAADPDHGGLLEPALAARLAADATASVSQSVVHGCGHSIQRERPPVVAAAVAAVLDREPRTGPDTRPAGERGSSRP
jgi:pimeloyl-ACP methyl ester carboxylesterase